MVYLFPQNTNREILLGSQVNIDEINESIDSLHINEATGRENIPSDYIQIYKKSIVRNTFNSLPKPKRF